MKKDLKINDIKVIQAPLAGISDIVYRKLVRKYSPECLLTTEMLSCEMLDKMPKKRTPLILQFEKCEYPLAFQLVGHKPEMFARCAKMLENIASAIDLNFGCPVNKVVKSNDGAGMMKTPSVAVDIVKRIKDVINIPISAKFRLGWSKDDENYIEFAKMLEGAGVDFVILHARTRSQMYGGRADWEKIAKLKAELKIPVFANGDIKTVEDATNCLKITGADGVSIGRGIIGDFSLPAQISHFLKTGKMGQTISMAKKIDMLFEHFEGEIALRGELNAVKFMRKFYPFYISGISGASKLRQTLVGLEKFEDVKKVFERDLLF